MYMYMYMLLSHSRPRWSRVDVDVRMGLIIWLQLELGLAVTLVSLFPSLSPVTIQHTASCFSWVWSGFHVLRMFDSHCD